MLREVTIINYLPEYVQEYQEMQKIMTAENPELQFYWENIETSKDNMFPVTADENGLTRFEAMLQLNPQDDDTVDDRRARVLSKYNSMTVYTISGLKDMLAVLCGSDYSVDLEASKYTLKVGIGLASIKQFNIVYQMLSDVIPCNIDWTLFVIYNRWQRFETLTWGSLETETWEGLHSDRKWQEEST